MRGLAVLTAPGGLSLTVVSGLFQTETLRRILQSCSVPKKQPQPLSSPVHVEAAVVETLRNRAGVEVVRSWLLLAQLLLLQEAGSPTPGEGGRTWTPTSATRGACAWTTCIQVFMWAALGLPLLWKAE